MPEPLAPIPEIILLPAKKLVGMCSVMSLAKNTTHLLWQNFMPGRNEIENRVSSDFISMQMYDEPMQPGNLTQEFTKWAGVEVSHCSKVPQGMECFVIPEGQYAVFHYKGLPADAGIFRYIFGVWLPMSEYELDNRPQFEVLGEKYKNGSADSEEDIYIPLKNR